MEEINRLQDYLLLIRRAVGWTAEEFGNQIGVTRQTINNIESGRNKLNKTQYIAMRSVLDAEIVRCPEETEMLRLLLDVFVDHPEKYKESDKDKLLDKANLVTPSILAGTASRATVSKEWMKAAGAIGLVAGAGAALAAMPLGIVGGVGVVSAWLAKSIMSSDKKKK
ncbi:MAG: helix-turn-helix transcriptional regulator [Lachnospiraceae bacterium]|nr:helix-turn-helix transcriptional regulator [Lachnospiraceae bacterium]